MSDDMAGFRRVAALSDVPESGCLAVQCGELRIVLVRRGERVDALDDTCPHAGAPLSEGFVEGGLLTCAWHGWSFAVDSGCSADGTDASVPVHEVRVEAGDVFVRLPGAGVE